MNIEEGEGRERKKEERGGGKQKKKKEGNDEGYKIGVGMKRAKEGKVR